MNKPVKDAKNVSDIFLSHIQNSRIESAKQLLTEDFKDFDLNSLGYIKNIEDAGFGFINSSEISIEYLIHGNPADQRNIQFILFKINNKWLINDIVINYHISRSDKDLALKFYENFSDSASFSPEKFDVNIKADNLQEVYKEFSKINSKFILYDAEIIICTKKNCASEPVKVLFKFQSDDSKYFLNIETNSIDNNRWINKVWFEKI